MNDQYRETIVLDGRDETAGPVGAATRRIQAFERLASGVGRTAIRPVVSIVDRATAPLRALQNGLLAFGRNVTRGLGLGVGYALFGQLENAITGSVGAIGGFDAAMRSVATLSPAVEANLGGLSDQVLTLSSNLGVSAVDAANALYEAVSAGVPADNLLSFVAVASKAAIGGVTDTSTAIDGLTSIINAYKLSADDAGKVSDIMFQAVNLGKLTFGELASNIGTVAPIAASMGVDFTQVAGAAASLTKQGISAGEAMTDIRSVLVALEKPGEKMTNVISSLGYSSGGAMVKALGFQGSVEAIAKASAALGYELPEVTGRVEGMQAILGLTGDNAKGAHDDLLAMANSAGVTENAFRIMSAGIDQSWKRLMAGFQAGIIRLGAKVLPVLAPLVSGLADKLPGAMDALGNALTPVLGLVERARPVFIGIGDAISAIYQAVTSDPGALGVVADLIEKAFGPEVAGAARTFLAVGMKLIPTIGRIAATLGNLFSGKLTPGEALGAIGGVLAGLGKTIQHEMGVLGDRAWWWLRHAAIPALTTNWNALMDAVKGWVDGGGLERLGTALSGLAKGAWSWLVAAAGTVGTFLQDNLVTPIRNWVSVGGPGKVAAALSGLGDRAWEWLSGVGGDVSKLLDDHLVIPIRNWVSIGGPGKVAAELLALGGRAWEWVTVAAGQAGAFLGGIINSIITWATTGGPGRVRDALLPLANEAWAWVQTAVSNAPGQLMQIVTSVQTWAQGEQGQAVLAVAKDLGGKFYDQFSGGWALGITSSGIETFFGQLITKLQAAKVPEDLQQSWQNLRDLFDIIKPLIVSTGEAMAGPVGLANKLDIMGASTQVLAGLVKALSGFLQTVTADMLAVAKAVQGFISWANQNDVWGKLEKISGAAGIITNPGGALGNFVSSQITGGGTSSTPAPTDTTATADAGAANPHAAGGIVTSPHVGLVGEAGPEAIVPLDQASRYGFGGVTVGDVHVSVSFAGTADPGDARDLARRLGPELARELARQIRLVAPGVVGA